MIWTSALQRTVATAAPLGCEIQALRALNEIDAGICDGLTYEEIKERMPDEPDGEFVDDVEQRRQIEHMLGDAVHCARRPRAVAVAAGATRLTG